MERWFHEGIFQVRDILRTDAEYQRLLCEIDKAEVRYTQIMAKLSPEERLEIDNYIALCEELEYQWTQTAYSLARKG